MKDSRIVISSDDFLAALLVCEPKFYELIKR